MTQPTALEALRMIAADMESDAREFDGQPLTGRTVAEYNGRQGAAIAALANILANHLETFQAALDDAVEAHCENRPHIYSDGSTS